MLVKLLDFSPEIRRVKTLVRETLDSARGKLAREVVDYVLRDGGKFLRPKLLLMAARANDPFSREPLPEDEPFLRFAAGVEILHTASLVHDDVVDKAATRRGRPSVNAQYGEDVAILIADLLFSQAFEIAVGVGVGNSRALTLLCRTTRIMCESELYQIEKRNGILTEEDYLHIIGSKTAALFSTCAELGAILSGSDEDRVRTLAEFGLQIGMAYQIADDALDYTARSAQWGKPVGNDLAQGKLTLPLIHAFEQADSADRDELLHHLRNGRHMEKVLPVIHKYRGLEYAAEKARGYAQRAGDLLRSFVPPSSAAQFEAFCRFTIERGY